MKTSAVVFLHVLLCACLTGAVVHAQHYPTNPEDVKAAVATPDYSPYAGRGYPTQVFWGDTHLHTALSVDAGLFGNRLGMDEAYRFARGEEVTASTGLRARLSRPLDFLVISDHSDGMGFFQMILEGDPLITAEEVGRRWHRMVNAGGEEAVAATLELIDTFSRGKMPWNVADPSLMRPVWDRVIEAAERHNDPGRFTAFIGYEWTSLVPPGNNLHRVVIYRDGGEQASRTLPFTNTESQDPEDLWTAMETYEEKTGGRVLAIPHNGNLSNGMMFDVETLDGKALDRGYAERRFRLEPLYEVTQIKGDGEAHPFLSPNDEYADYGTWDLGNLNLSEPKTNDMLQYEYARSALKLGLQLEDKLGVNPFKFGLIGSTDSHTSLATAAEENFFGKHSGTEPKPERADHVAIGAPDGSMAYMGWEQVASGYAAVWARENTREAIFDAMMRKETYATTGPRMMVRFFGGWEFETADANTRNPAGIGYAKGVPMGGDLKNAPDGKAPTFLVAALKDSYGGNLDRIQIVKGWMDGDGSLHERVYDVAVSDDRKIGKDGRCKKAVGNTVDVENATWTNTIGDPELIAVWEDPDFDPAQRAFYYTRVLEIPTPRWTAYDAKRFGIKMPKDAEMFSQERAYTSPIWYTP
jgi:hypothetical protein